jgi:hypothetical protein
MTVAAFAALAVMAFVWYMLWGYRTNGQTRPDTENPSG